MWASPKRLLVAKQCNVMGLGISWSEQNRVCRVSASFGTLFTREVAAGIVRGAGGVVAQVEEA
jgi:hypothetical protein